MRISPISNCYAHSRCNSKMQPAKYNGEATISLEQDSVSFKSKATKGAGIGAAFGVAALAAISALSGGLATPLAFGVYAATMGTAGGLIGNELDNIDNKNKKDE